MAALGKDVFVAIAAVAWADGHLDPEEADAIVRAAVEEGLELDAIADIEKATSKPVPIGELDRASLSKLDRLFVWAIARWVATIDGKVTAEEEESLKALGDRLGVPERPRAACEALVREVASLPDGDRPLRYDLARLRALIGDRLGQVASSIAPPPGT